MSDDPPTPPVNLPKDLVDTLNESAPERLRNVSRYAEELAEYKEREAHIEKKSENDDIEKQPDDLPDDVPPKATITIKKINENRYYYWQWREGEKIKSKYKSPVEPGE